MTPEECQAATSRHIAKVQNLLRYFAELLERRGWDHDASKLQDPELAIFTEFTPKLKGLTYGSKEYKQALAEMEVALRHHYAANRHHPEYYKNGITGMTFMDLIEMFFDWKAASERHEDGNIFTSIVKNTARFGIPWQLAQIMTNTARELWPSEEPAG